MIKDIITGHKIAMPAGVHTELRAQINSSRGVAMLSGNIVSNARSDVSGVSARCYKNGVYGFSSMAELSDDAVRSVLKAAQDNA
ncbi:MAG: TldD/PmbA family protein, partial [Oscillospiraceae bacterium]|nr:TldD/PmbA family protein [Oscillospiraceae bacterium]